MDEKTERILESDQEALYTAGQSKHHDLELLQKKEIKTLLLALMAAQQTCVNMPYITVSQDKVLKIKLKSF